MNFDYAMPTKIIFGRGRLEELGKFCRSFGDNAIIISGRVAIRKTGILNKAIKSLEAESINFILSENISANPTSSEVDEAISLARKHHSNVVIGIGGGSALDAAKAAAVGVGYHSSTIRDLIGKNLIPSSHSLPIIAIPTTAGTGSEVSKGAIITDIVRNFKSGIRGDDLFPKIAIVDSELISSMPINVARETGFDALTHAIETYIARRSNPINATLSEKALQLLGSNLPMLIIGNRTPEIEDSLSLAALLGGINVANCGTCIPHRLQQAMSSLPHVQTSHGQGLAILYSSWLSIAYPFAKEKFDRIAKLLNGSNIKDIIDKFINGFQFNKTLSDLGITFSDIPVIIKNISGAVENDPIDNIDHDLLELILKNAL
jgi:alcohol dehydrogenase class IV